MIFLDLGYVFVITLVLTAIFAVGFRRQRTWPVVLVFFVILFLATWAAGVWITPATALPGASRLPYMVVVIGLIAAIIVRYVRFSY